MKNSYALGLLGHRITVSRSSTTKRNHLTLTEKKNKSSNQVMD